MEIGAVPNLRDHHIGSVISICYKHQQFHSSTSVVGDFSAATLVLVPLSISAMSVRASVVGGIPMNGFRR